MSEGPRDAVYRNPLMQNLAQQIAQGLAPYAGVKVSDPEPVVDYLERMGWIESMNGKPPVLEVTPLGLALLHALRKSDLTPVSERDGAAATTVLDPDNRFVYLELTRLVAAAGAGMLVHPYFKPDMLEWLINATSIERLLVGSRTRDQKLGAEQLRIALKALEGVPGVDRLAIRASSSSRLHDRSLIHADKTVQMLTTSVTGVGRHLSTISAVPKVGADAIKREVESLWKSAEPLQPAELRRP